jgi:hypothetical protein
MQLGPVPAPAGRGLLEDTAAAGGTKRLGLDLVALLRSRLVRLGVPAERSVTSGLLVALGDASVAEQHAAAGFHKRSFTKGSGPSGGALLGYARVSKGDEQNNALQTKALRAAGCRRLFEAELPGQRMCKPLIRWRDWPREAGVTGYN